MSYKTALENVLREIETMKKLNHQNLVKLHEIINDEEDEKLYIVIDLAHKGPVLD